MANLVIPRREIWTQQPQGPTSTQEVFGYQVGEVVCPTVALHKISGGIGVAARASGLAFIGDSVDNCASRSLTRPFVLWKDTELTFVCVFRRQGTAQTGNVIAGLGATGGNSGDTLFRITGGDTAANIKFQVQGSNGGVFYNVNSSGVTVNDRQTHTAVITLSLSVGIGTLEFVIDGKTAGGTTIAAGTPSATTFNSVTACASIRGGAVIGAGDADVTLAYPIFGKVSQAQAISLSLNPWQIFAPQSRQLFVPVGGGGSVNANASGALSAVSVAAPSASASGSASATGALATITISSPTATASAGGSAAASGSFAALSISPATATATATKSATASGAFAAISLSAPTATASGTTAGGANATCTPAQITISHATAIAIGSAVASGGYQSIGITAPSATASVGNGNATASGSWAAVSITAPTGYASSGFIRAPSGSGPTVIQPGGYRPRQSATSRPSNTGGRRY